MGGIIGLSQPITPTGTLSRYANRQEGHEASVTRQEDADDYTSRATTTIRPLYEGNGEEEEEDDEENHPLSELYLSPRLGGHA